MKTGCQYNLANYHTHCGDS